MIVMSFHTFRERWTLFVGALLSVALGVGMVQSSVAILVAVADSTVLNAVAPAARRELRQQLGDVSTLMGMTLTLGLFLTVFIVSSTFAFTVSERRRDLALLRIGGASRLQVRLLLLGEGALVGALGSVLGGALYLPLRWVQLGFLRRLVPGMRDLTLTASWWMPLVGPAIGVPIAVAGVLLAAQRAAKVRPLEALINTGRAARVMTTFRWVCGILMFGLSAAMVVAAQASHDVMVSMATGLGLIFTGSIALHQLSPLVVPVVGRALGLALRRHVLGDLAQAGLRDGVRRTAATAGPLIVLVGLVVGMFGILGSQTAAGAAERTQIYQADLVVTAPTGHGSDRIARTPGVATALRMSSLPDATASLVSSTHRRVPLKPEDAEVVAVDPRGYAAVNRVPTTAGTMKEFRDGTAVFGPDTMALVSPRQRSVTVTLADGRSFRLPAVAHLHETLGFGQGVLIPRASVPPRLLAGTPTTTFVQVAAGVSTDQVASRLRALRVGTVATLDSWSHAQANEAGDQNTLVMDALAGVGGSYALLSVINAIAIGSSQRKREFAVARVTGMHRADVIRAAVTESLAVAVIGLGLGTVVAGACLAGIRRGTEALLGRSVVEVPWAVLGLLSGASLCAVVTTTMLAAWSATRPAPVGLVAARE